MKIVLRGNSLGWQLCWVAIVLVEIVLNGNYPHGNFPGGNCPGGNCPGGNCSGGNCPGVLGFSGQRGKKIGLEFCSSTVEKIMSLGIMGSN